MLNRIPSLVQIAIVELLGVMCLGGGGIARVLDAFGLFGHPPLAPLTLSVAGMTLIGLFWMWLTLRPMWNPKFQQVSWSPVRHFGSVMVVVPHDPAAVRNIILTSHPAYVLMDIFAGILPAFMTYISWGDDPRHNPTMHVWHCSLAVWAVIPMARLFCWYVLGRGPDIVRAARAYLPTNIANGLEWRLAWQPVLIFWGIGIIVCLPGVYFGMRDLRESEARTPVLTTLAIAEIRDVPSRHADERFRLRGHIRGALRHWPGGEGKHPSAGLCVVVEEGTEVLVFADVHRLSALEKLAASGDGAEITCLVRLLADGGARIQPDFARYYDWRPEDFEPPLATGRTLTYYVDP